MENNTYTFPFDTCEKPNKNNNINNIINQNGAQQIYYYCVY